MNRRAVRALMCLALCLLLAAPAALAAKPTVSATPNQKLAFRTGPNTRYVELYTLPQSTVIRAVEYESGNGVTWVLVEYIDNSGMVCRGYTGLKRMTVNGSIPWANHLNQITSLKSGYATVSAAPYEGAAYRGQVFAGDAITLLDYEDNWAFIEFDDRAEGMPSRGYIDASLLNGATAAAAYPGVVNEPLTAEAAYRFRQRYPDYMPFTGLDAAQGFADKQTWTIASLLTAVHSAYYQVIDGAACARAEADTLSPVIEYLQRGRYMNVLGTWRGWALCLLEDIDSENWVCGWVDMSYLKLDSY